MRHFTVASTAVHVEREVKHTETGARLDIIGRVRGHSNTAGKAAYAMRAFLGMSVAASIDRNMLTRRAGARQNRHQGAEERMYKRTAVAVEVTWR